MTQLGFCPLWMEHRILFPVEMWMLGFAKVARVAIPVSILWMVPAPWWDVAPVLPTQEMAAGDRQCCWERAG